MEGSRASSLQACRGAGTGPMMSVGTPSHLLRSLPRVWWQVTRRSLKHAGEDNLTLIANGVAYSWFLALFPGLIAPEQQTNSRHDDQRGRGATRSHGSAG